MYCKKTDIWVGMLVLTQVLVLLLVKDGKRVLESLWQPGLGQVYFEAPLWILPFGGKQGLNYWGQWQAEEGILKIQHYTQLLQLTGCSAKYTGLALWGGCLLPFC